MTLSSGWGQIFKIFIDEEQQEFLTKVAELGQDNHSSFVVLNDLDLGDVCRELGWLSPDGRTSRCFYVADALHRLGLIRFVGWMGAGGGGRVTPKYVGIVRVTREEQTELHGVVEQALEEWETNSTEFKRELNLTKVEEKAEFIRDILALATTRTRPPRLFIVGFDNKTHRFHKSVDTKITQDRLEQILNAYTDPTPQIRYRTVRWETGTIGVIEAMRDPKDVPYQVKKRLGKSPKEIKVGDIFVRHGTHVEPPTPRELQDLIDEGKRARGEI